MTRWTLIFAIYLLTSCKATCPTMTFNTVKSGQDLNKIPLNSFDNFFRQRTHERRIPKIDVNVHELYRDSTFTYFGKYNIGVISSTPTFFKIYNDTLFTQFLNYNDFYGQELENFLWWDVIPNEDRDLFNNNIAIQQGQTKPSCLVSKNKSKNNYLLADKKVILTMTWEIECDELAKLKDKKYQAIYNLTTKQFEK